MPLNPLVAKPISDTGRLNFACQSKLDLANGPVLSITLEQNSCAVGLSRIDNAGAGLEDNSVSPESGRDSQLLLTHVADLLAGTGVGLSQLQAIAFGAGPGGFTRVRVACAVAQGLAFGQNIPLLPVDSMQARALAALRAFEAGESPVDSGAAVVLVLADARMKEVYAGAYRVDRSGADTNTNAGPVEEIFRPGLMAATSVAQWLTERSASTGRQGGLLLLVADAGLSVAAEQTGDRQEPVIQMVSPDALMILRAVHELAMFTRAVTPADAGPIYLREKVALNIEEQAALRESAVRAKK